MTIVERKYPRRQGVSRGFRREFRPHVEQLESRLLLSATFPNLQYYAVPVDNPALPAGMDTFTPPVDGQAPSSAAPGLAAITQTGSANDVLALTGDQFSSYTGAAFGKDSQFLVYGQTTPTNGTLSTASVLQESGSQASIVLPAALPASATYFVWAQNSAGTGFPLAVNQTQAWWTGPDVCAAGQSISVYGQNLAYYPSTYTGTNQSWIYIEPSGGGGQWVTPTAVNPYKVTFTVPAGLANGTYQVWVNNGHGGVYGWSQSGNITVQHAVTWTGPIINVKSYGATGNGTTDDTAAIDAAMAAAVPGNQIYFPTGTYCCSSQLIAAPAGVRIYGDGPANSVLETAIKIQSNSQIDDMMVWVPSSYTISPQGVGSQIWMQNVYFQEDHDPNVSNIYSLDIGSASYVFINDCNFTGNQVWLAASNNFSFNGCNFYQRFDAGDCVGSWGASSLSVTNCTAQSYNTSNPDSDSGWGQGRFVYAANVWGKAENTYIAGNSVNQFVPRLSANANDNSGEQILFEGDTAPWEGAVTSATFNTITFNAGNIAPNDDEELIIVGGTGFGQVRDISSVASSNEGYTATVTQPWNVVPDATSQLQIVDQPERFVVYDNNQSGTTAWLNSSAWTANCGFQPYQGATDMVIDGNTYTNERAGINFMTVPGGNDGNNGGTRLWWCMVLNNTFNNTGVVDNSDANDPTSTVVGPQILADLWRNNTVNTVLDAAFDEGGKDAINTGPGSIALEIFDKNQATNVPVGYSLCQGVNSQDAVLYQNNFSLGTAAASGSAALQFGTLDPDMAGRGGTGAPGTPGLGWSGPWYDGNQYNNPTTSYMDGQQLSYSAAGYSNTGNGSGPTDGSVGQTAATSDWTNFSDRLLTTPLTGTIWVSALVNRDEAQNIAIGLTPDCTGANNTFIGLGGSNQAVMDYFFQQYTATVTASLGTTYLLLAEINMNYSGTYDKVSYWFNPSLSGGQSGLGTPTLVEGGVDALGPAFQGVGVLVDRSSGATASSLIDSIRISNDPTYGFTNVTNPALGNGDLVADYFNGDWGPVLAQPITYGNTLTGFQTTYGGVTPLPGDVLDLPTRVLTATATAGGTGQVTLPIWNVGIGSMRWSGSSDSSWLTLSSSSGSVGAGSASGITLTCNASGLSNGTYTGTVTLTTTDGQIEEALVEFTSGTVPTVTLTATSPNASDTGPVDGTFTVTRTGATSSALTVTYSIAGTAVNGTDYSTLTGSVVIAAGQSSANITVVPIDDGVAKNTETVILALTDGAYGMGGPFSGMVSIANHDTTTLTVTALDPVISETGGVPGTFQFNISAAAAMNITVNYNVSGTAIDSGPDPDYTPTLLGSVVIPAGQTSATVSITPAQNGAVEGSETTILTATSGTSYTVGSPASATVTITNSNTPSQVEWLTMDDGSGATATDYSGNGNNATLQGGTTWTTDTPTGSGYALSFDGATGYATIPASPSLNIGNNMTVSMWVKGTSPSGYPRLLGNDYSPSGVDTGEGIEIQADANTASVGLSIFTSGGGIYQDGGVINNVINGSWNQIAYTFSNGIVEEYLNGVNVGTTAYNRGNNDGIGSPNPWILGAVAASNGNWAGEMGNFRVYNYVLSNAQISSLYTSEIVPTVAIAATTPNAYENGPQNGIFTVTRSGSTAGAMAVNYTISGTAVNGTNYSAIASSVTIPSGQSSATIDITPVQGLAVGDQTVILTLASGTGYTAYSASPTATVVVSDNGLCPTATLTATTPTAMAKGSAPGIFTVTRTGSTASALTLNYTIGGTATNTTDYSTLSSSVTIPAGQSSATVGITPVDLGNNIGNETVILTLARSSIYCIGSSAAGTVTILPDNMVDWLPMNNGSGTTATDSSGYGNAATLLGGTTWTTDTPTGDGYALSFNGSSGCYATIPASSSLDLSNNMTLSMWVKGASPNGYPRLLGNDYSQSGAFTYQGIEIQADNDSENVGLSIFTSGGGTYQDGGQLSNVMSGSWNQVAYTFSNGVVEAYLNGVNVYTQSYNPGYENGFSNPNPWNLGAVTSSSGNWTGEMDDFHVFDAVLSSAQIAAIYASEQLKTPTMVATDAGGIYNSNPFPASATVNSAGSLEGVSPTCTYYVGTGTSGINLGTTAPSTADTYTVVASFAGSADYLAANSSPVTFHINKVTPTVVATDPGGTYNTSSFPATATVAGVGSQSAAAGSLETVSPTFTYYVGTGTGGTNLGSAAPVAAGTYTVVASFAGSADYTAAVSSPATFTISQAMLNVTAGNWPSAGLTLILDSEGNSHAYITGTTADIVTPYSLAHLTNIQITAASGTAAKVTIDSTNGDPIPAGSLNYGGSGGLIKTGLGMSTLSGTNTYTGGTTVLAGVLRIANSSALPRGSSLTVGAGGTLIFGSSPSEATTCTVTASANPSVYGQSVTLTATVNIVAPGSGTPTGMVIFMADGTTLGTGTLGANGQATLSTSALSVDSHTITAWYGGDANFAASTIGTLADTVTPAPLTITANNATMVYGGALPALTASFNGFVNGETPANLTTLPTLTTTATSVSAVGSYPITASGAVDPNYNISYVAGTLTIAPAGVSGVSPNAGPTAGGTVVTISGANLSSVTGVYFGAAAAAGFSLNAENQIVATSPAGMAGAVDVTVTTPQGSSIASPADQFRYVAAPIVTSFATSSGGPWGDTIMTIYGSNLADPTTAVFFGATPATSFSIISVNQIVAVCPPGAAAATVTVVNAGGASATLPAGQPAASLASVSPVIAQTSGSVASDAFFASDRSALAETVPPAEIRQSVCPWAWTAAIESPSNAFDQNQKNGSTVEAVDKILAQYGL